MKILMVTPDLPAPPTSGGRVRASQLLREIGRRHEVDVLAPDRADPPAIAASRRLCRRLALYPSPPEGLVGRSVRLWRSLATARLHHLRPRVREAIERALSEEEYDLVHFVTPYLFPSFPPGTSVPTTVDFFGTSIGIQRELVTQRHRVARMKSRLRYRFALRGERWVLRRADVAIAISGADRDFLRKLDPRARIEVVPLGVDTRYFAPQGIPSEPARLVFVGDLSFRPNVEGACHLVKEILPRLRERDARVRLDLVGRAPAPEVVELAQRDGVRVTGAVDDVRPFLSRASVVVIPLLGGSGVRTKTLEAMAMERAVVSTSMGVEGLDALREGDLRVADGPEAFARAVLELLSSEDARACMGQRARVRVMEHYDSKATTRLAERVFASISAHDGERSAR